jgi:hypothetical protein
MKKLLSVASLLVLLVAVALVAWADNGSIPDLSKYTKPNYGVTWISITMYESSWLGKNVEARVTYKSGDSETEYKLEANSFPEIVKLIDARCRALERNSN